MGQLRRAILMIAATFAFVSPCAAKVIKFEILKVESPASRELIRAPLLPEEDAGLFITGAN